MFNINQLKPLTPEQLKLRQEEAFWRNIGEYKINEDGTYTNLETVNFAHLKLESFPISFKESHGDFHCNNNKLTSLKGCPEIVYGDFNCFRNKLTSLEFCPKIITGTFLCYRNSITNWDYFPEEIGKGFYCDYFVYFKKNSVKAFREYRDKIHNNFLFNP